MLLLHFEQRCYQYLVLEARASAKLTPEGERVLKCIGGGTLATLLGRPDLISLGSLVGC